jgi:hypothetical protein
MYSTLSPESFLRGCKGKKCFYNLKMIYVVRKSAITGRQKEAALNAFDSAIWRRNLSGKVIQTLSFGLS